MMIKFVLFLSFVKITSIAECWGVLPILFDPRSEGHRDKVFVKGEKQLLERAEIWVTQTHHLKTLPIWPCDH